VISPKFEPWWVLWIHATLGSSVHQRCSNCRLTNLLFGLCRSVWVIKVLINLFSPHSKALAHPSTLKCCGPGACPNLFSFHYLHLWIHNWVHQGAWGCVKIGYSIDPKCCVEMHLQILLQSILWSSICRKDVKKPFTWRNQQWVIPMNKVLSKPHWNEMMFWNKWKPQIAMLVLKN